VELLLPETLRRLRTHAEEQDLNPQELAAHSALPEPTVRALLRGDDLQSDTVEERVCTRVKTLADAYVVRTQKRMGDLVAEVAGHLNISPAWARKLLKGEKVPSVKLLHGIVEFFKVEGGEAFFTAPSADALNRVLLPKLAKYEDPASDPVQVLMMKYGVVAADLRHQGAMTPAQLEVLLAGVIKSVMPPEGDVNR
jgi:transcriptional regulator with XRE-family HTH domain